MTFQEFMRDRLAEDDGRVDGAYQGDEIGYPMDDQMRWLIGRLDDEVDVKRAILNLHERTEDGECGLCIRAVHSTTGDIDGEEWPCATLRAISLPYADHPDYDPEWRP